MKKPLSMRRAAAAPSTTAQRRIMCEEERMATNASTMAIWKSAVGSNKRKSTNH
jgi:hypothetical protein